MSPNIYRILLRRLSLLLVLASLPLQGETLQYPIPSFASRAWHPETTVTTRVEDEYGWVTRMGAQVTRLVDPEPYWIATTYKTIAWEDEFEDVFVPAVIGSRWIDPVVGVRPVEYTVTIPESGHYETTPESTGTRSEEVTGYRDEWVDTSYDDWVFLDGWDGDYYWWWEGWVHFEDGYWTTVSFTETVQVTYTIPESTTWIVDEPEHEETRTRNEDYEITPGYNQDYEITPATTLRVLVRAAGSQTVVDVEGHWHDDAPYTVTEREPDSVVLEVIVPAHFVTTTSTPGYWENVTVPETTLTVNTDDISNITSLLWSATNYKHDGQFDIEVPAFGVPHYADRLLVDPNFLREYAEDDSDTVWNEAMSFFCRGRMQMPPPTQPHPNRVLPVLRNGRWEVLPESEVVPVTREEATALIEVLVLDVAIKLREKRGEVWSYLTYEKYSLTDPLVRVYAGKTAGIGQPLAVMTTRELRHYWKRPDLGPGIINSAIVTRKEESGAEYAMLGREQSLIDWHDLSAQLMPTPGYAYSPRYPGDPYYSRSDNMRKTDSRPDGQRAVDKWKLYGYIYWDHARHYHGYLWEFTGLVAEVNPNGIKTIDSIVSFFDRGPLSWNP